MTTTSTTIELKEPGAGVPRDISSSLAAEEAEVGGAERVLQARQGAQICFHCRHMLVADKVCKKALEGHYLQFQ
uniref:Uncharacterized protein n=1 Tax=Aegilops tauschii subsp. strangulata TaxID=200361 RepID=A0A453L0Y9_AEGTS